jgi:hypothetical protein
LKRNDERKYYKHSNENLLRQKIYQIIAGYAEDDASDYLTRDPVFTQIIGTSTLASQPSLSRFYTRFDIHSLFAKKSKNPLKFRFKPTAFLGYEYLG